MTSKVEDLNDFFNIPDDEEFGYEEEEAQPAPWYLRDPYFSFAIAGGVLFSMQLVSWVIPNKLKFRKF